MVAAMSSVSPWYASSCAVDVREDSTVQWSGTAAWIVTLSSKLASKNEKMVTFFFMFVFL